MACDEALLITARGVGACGVDPEGLRTIVEKLKELRGCLRKTQKKRVRFCFIVVRGIAEQGIGPDSAIWSAR
jgi:hypothetical protein